MPQHNTGTPRTEADLLTNLFQDGQANNSITAQDMRDFVASTRYLQPLGWEFRFDSFYTSGSPLALTDIGGAGTPEKITFSNNPGEDLRYPSTFPEIWNTVTDRLDISGFANGFGIIRVSCIASSPTASATHIEMLMDVGSDPIGPPPDTGTSSNLIYEDTRLFAKGNNVPQAFNWIVPLFGGSDFVANGGRLLLQSHGGDASAWQLTLTAGAILVPNPAGEG
jgi:hypothetical protein